MPTRFLKESICTSESLASLDAETERFWYRLIVQCDDYGRMDARPAVLRAACFPLMLDTVGESDVVRWLENLTFAGMISLYAINGKPYLCIASFNAYNSPRAKASKYPNPQDDDGTLAGVSAFANICLHVQADANTCTQRKADSPDHRIRIRKSIIEDAAADDDSEGTSVLVNLLLSVTGGTMTGYGADWLKDARTTHGDEVLAEALRRAAKSGGRTFGYVDKVLATLAEEKRTGRTSPNGKSKLIPSQEPQA